MRIVQIIGNQVHWITPWTKIEEVPPFAPDIVFVEAPQDVEEGWIFQDGRFIGPNGDIPEGQQQIPLVISSNEMEDVSLIVEVLKDTITSGKVDLSTSLKTLNNFLETGKITKEQYQELVLSL